LDFGNFFTTCAEIGIGSCDASGRDVEYIIEVDVEFVDIELILTEEMEVVFLFFGILLNRINLDLLFVQDHLGIFL
jgi:septum formation inhibitor-activating ATPase MinD